VADSELLVPQPKDRHVPEPLPGLALVPETLPGLVQGKSPRLARGVLHDLQAHVQPRPLD
jgi:hypothetical protein